MMRNSAPMFYLWTAKFLFLFSALESFNPILAQAAPKIKSQAASEARYTSLTGKQSVECEKYNNKEKFYLKSEVNKRI